MCTTFYIEEEEVTSIGQLKNYVQLDEFCVAEFVDDRKAMLDSFRDSECLCHIDPITIALRLHSKMIFDPDWGNFTFELLE